MVRRNFYPFLLIGAAILGVFLYRQRAVVFSQSSPSDGSVVSFLVRFGLTDTEPRPWDGTLAASNGELVSLRNWHQRPGDRIDGKTGWSLATRKGPLFQRRPWEEEALAAPASYTLTPGIVVDVKSGAGTKVEFKTRNGNFEVRPADLRAPLRLLNGSVMAERVPAAQLVSDNGYQNDFASMLSGSDGEVWLAWVAYRSQGDEVFVRRFDGARWGSAQKVTAFSPKWAATATAIRGWSGQPR